MTELADEELEKAGPTPWYVGIVWADVARIGLPAIALCVVVVLLTLHYVRPAPPTSLTIASGAVDTRFYDVAKRYQQILKRSGITLKIDAHADGKRLFEGRAEAASTSNHLTYLVPNLIEAMFTNFPGNSGKTVRITVAPEKK